MKRSRAEELHAVEARERDRVRQQAEQTERTLREAMRQVEARRTEETATSRQHYNQVRG